MAQNNKKNQKNEDEKSGSPFRRAPAQQVMGNRAGEMLIEKRAREGSPNIQKTEKCTGKRTCKNKQKP